MKKYQTVLFDLDGTLTDSAPGILNCVRYALSELGRPVPADNVLMGFLGPPLSWSYREICGLSQDEAALAVKIYRSRYDKTVVSENALFDGIPETLERLRSAGLTLGVATSKLERYALEIISGFGLDKYFSVVKGSDPSEPECGKEVIIRQALERCGAVSETAVMVGDRRYDIEGARAAGIDSIGVLFGYGTCAELETVGADYLAGSPAEVVDIVLTVC